ncbi:hypothetical protein BDV3_002735 [Batrachochytrium dendrobatidis]
MPRLNQSRQKHQSKTMLQSQHIPFLQQWRGRTRPLLIEPELNVNHLKPIKQPLDSQSNQPVLYPTWWGHEEHVVACSINDSSVRIQRRHSELFDRQSTLNASHAIHNDSVTNSVKQVQRMSLLKKTRSNIPAGVETKPLPSEAWAPLPDPKSFPKRTIDEFTQTDTVRIVDREIDDLVDAFNQTRLHRTSAPYLGHTNSIYPSSCFIERSDIRHSASSPILKSESPIRHGTAGYNTFIPFDAQQSPTRDVGEESMMTRPSKYADTSAKNDPHILKSEPLSSPPLTKKIQSPVSFVVPLSPVNLFSANTSFHASPTKRRSSRRPTSLNTKNSYGKYPDHSSFNRYDQSPLSSVGHQSFTYPQPSPKRTSSPTRDGLTYSQFDHSITRSRKSPTRNGEQNRSLSESRFSRSPSPLKYRSEMTPSRYTPTINTAASTSKPYSQGSRSVQSTSSTRHHTEPGVMQLVDTFLASSFIQFLDTSGINAKVDMTFLDHACSDAASFVTADASMNEVHQNLPF